MLTVRRGCLVLALLLLAGCGASDSETATASHEAALPAGADDAMALRPIMQQLGTAMAALQHALWLGDVAQVEAQAAAIAAHAHISAAENARIERVLGAELSAFQEADETVHQAALRMHEAARDRDTEAVLVHLAAVQRGCVACHSRFRERLLTTE